jgi:hypothetical protein
LLTLRYPVHKYYSAVRKGKDPAFPSPATTYLAVTRRQFVVRRYAFPRLQFSLLEALAARKPVGEALRLAVQAENPDPGEFAGQLREWFRNWTAEGFFQGVQLSD